MSSPLKDELKHIVVTTDMSQLGNSALRYTVDWLAQLNIPPPRVTLLFAAQKAGDLAKSENPDLDPAYDALRDVIREHAGSVAVRPAILNGMQGVAPAIASYADTQHVDLIVIASHGRSGIAHALLGSVAENLVTCAPCPVMVLPGTELQALSPLPARILVTTDFSENSLKAFPAAREIYCAYGISKAQLTLLHVAEDLARETFGQTLGGSAEAIRQDAEQQANTALIELLSAHFSGLPVMSTVVRATQSATQEISQYIQSHNVDLIVIASQGKTGMQRFVLGSMSRHLLQTSRKKVLVIPHTAVS